MRNLSPDSYFSVIAWLLPLGMLFLGVEHCVAQEQTGLPDVVAEAMKQINEKRVRTTISFLASDELGGRDTPSQGLNIASAYVASRFRGAGLEPLGSDDFFQRTEVATSQLPATGTVLVEGEPLEVLGVLGAGGEDVDWTGKVTPINDQTPRNQQFDAAVSLVAPSFDKQRASRSFQFQLMRLQQNGAKAILIQVEPDHPLIAQATQSLRPRLVRVRGSLNLPVLLVEPNDFEGETKIQMAKQKFGKSEVKNVIGILKGSDPELSKEAIVITAHLDHIGQFSGVGDTINNGADDDATGVTAVLALADAYTQLPTAPKRSVIFMTFWGEEKGLLGSKYYADNPEWPLTKTVANINLEMLGRPEPGASGKAWMTGWDQSDLGSLMADGAKDAGVLVFEHPKFSAMLYNASDNASFVRKGVIGHSFSAGSLHDDYHQPSDEWEKLQLDHMTKVIQGLFAGSLPIANGEVTPKAATKSRRQR